MASVSLSRIIEKFKLENLTPEIETKGIKITRRISTDRRCSLQVILSITRQHVCRSSDLWNIPI